MGLGKPFTKTSHAVPIILSSVILIIVNIIITDYHVNISIVHIFDSRRTDISGILLIEISDEMSLSSNSITQG